MKNTCICCGRDFSTEKHVIDPQCAECQAESRKAKSIRIATVKL